MVGPSGLSHSPSRRGSWFNWFAPSHVGFGVLLLCVLWTPCLSCSRSPRPTCKRRVKLIYKGLCYAVVSKSKNIVIFALCFCLPTIERKSESKK
jgi:hypothetical protein